MKIIIIIILVLFFNCQEELNDEKRKGKEKTSNEISYINRNEVIEFINNYMKSIEDYVKPLKSLTVEEENVKIKNIRDNFYSKEMNIITFMQVAAGTYLPSGKYKINDIKYKKNEIIINLTLTTFSRYDNKKKKRFYITEEIEDTLVLVLEDGKLRIGTYFLKIIGIATQ